MRERYARIIFKVFVKKARASQNDACHPFTHASPACSSPLTCCHAHSCLMNWSCDSASILSSASNRRSLRSRSRLLQKKLQIRTRTLAETFSCKRTCVGKTTSHTCVCVCVCVLCVFVCGRTVLFPTRHESENSCRSQRLRMPVQGTQRHTIYRRKDHVLIGHDEIMELLQPLAKTKV